MENLNSVFYDDSLGLGDVMDEVELVSGIGRSWTNKRAITFVSKAVTNKEKDTHEILDMVKRLSKGKMCIYLGDGHRLTGININAGKIWSDESVKIIAQNVAIFPKKYKTIKIAVDSFRVLFEALKGFKPDVFMTSDESQALRWAEEILDLRVCERLRKELSDKDLLIMWHKCYDFDGWSELAEKTGHASAKSASGRFRDFIVPTIGTKKGPAIYRMLQELYMADYNLPFEFIDYRTKESIVKLLPIKNS